MPGQAGNFNGVCFTVVHGCFVCSLVLLEDGRSAVSASDSIHKFGFSTTRETAMLMISVLSTGFFDRSDQRIQRLLGISEAGEIRGEAPLALLDQPAYVGASYR